MPTCVIRALFDRRNARGTMCLLADGKRTRRRTRKRSLSEPFDYYRIVALLYFRRNYTNMPRGVLRRITGRQRRRGSRRRVNRFPSYFRTSPPPPTHSFPPPPPATRRIVFARNAGATRNPTRRAERIARRTRERIRVFFAPTEMCGLWQRLYVYHRSTAESPVFERVPSAETVRCRIYLGYFPDRTVVQVEVSVEACLDRRTAETRLTVTVGL